VEQSPQRIAVKGSDAAQLHETLLGHILRVGAIAQNAIARGEYHGRMARDNRGKRFAIGALLPSLQQGGVGNVHESSRLYYPYSDTEEEISRKIKNAPEYVVTSRKEEKYGQTR
jgi:hypothetical protein